MNETTQDSGSMFDPESFVTETVDQAFETERRQCPAGEFQAMIGDFDSKAIQKFDFVYRQGPNAGQPGSMVKLNLPYEIRDQKAVDAVCMPIVRVYQEIVLDMNDQGKLNWGPNKNLELGRIRTAVGQNTGGQPWSVLNLRGAGPVIVKVDHEPFNRKDGSRGEKVVVTKVVKAS